jgi:hypothetical protein
MSRIVMVVLIYHRHKPIDLSRCIAFVLFHRTWFLARACSDFTQMDNFLDKNCVARHIENVSPCNVQAVGNRQWV